MKGVSTLASKHGYPPRLFFWALFVLVLLVACSDSQPISDAPAQKRSPVQLSAEVDRAEATAGDVITYRVTLDREPEIDVVLPNVFEKITGIKVKSISEEGPTTRDGRYFHRKIFELQAFEPGSYILPEVRLTYKDADGKEQAVGAPQIFLEIKSVLEAADPQATPEPLADIKPPVVPPRDYAPLFRWGGIGVGVLGIVVGGIVWWRRRKRAALPPPPPVPPWEVALLSLETLRKANLVEAGDARTFSFTLSEILRRYLEQRFRFPALEETTEEVLASLRRASLPVGKVPDLIRRVLTGTDWVKFAKQTPTRDDAEELLQAATEVVHLTTPLPEKDNEIPKGSGKEGV